MINFLEVEKKEDVKLSLLRRKVYTLTTVILVGSLVALAGFLGWWGYLEIRYGMQLREYQKLSAAVKSYAEAEVMIRKLADRSQVVVDYLNSRGEAHKKAAVLLKAEDAVMLKNWIYSSDPKQLVTVESDNTTTASLYANRLSGLYQGVVLDRAVWGTEGVWVSTLTLKGEMNAN